MASYFFAPDPVQSTFLIPGGNTPGNGAQLFIYVAGSVSTKTTVYKDNAGNAAWSNPIVLDAGGNLPLGGVVWIPAGVTIKAVWAPSNDTDPPSSPYRTIDNIQGINDTTASVTDWIPGPTPTFISSTQFTLVGDQTAVFTKSRRLKFTVTAGTVYGTISSASFGVVTTVNVAFASGALDSGLSAVFYSLIDPSLPSVNADYSGKQASTVPSSGNGTTNIWGIAGDSVHVSGTNSIFSFSSAPYSGARRKVIFDAALILSSSAALTMPGNLNVTTSANDIAEIYANTVSTSIVSFYKINGYPTIGPQSSGNVYAGPSSGANALPSFRPLVSSDIASAISNVLVGTFFIASTAAASSATIDFTSTVINSLYDAYQFKMVGLIPATDNQTLSVRFSIDNGATFKAGATDYHFASFGLDEGANDRNNVTTGAAQISVGGSNGFSNTPPSGGLNGDLKLYNVNTSSGVKVLTWLVGYQNLTNGATINTGAGTGVLGALVSSSVNAVRFLMPSGNLNSGTIYVYGSRKS